MTILLIDDEIDVHLQIGGTLRRSDHPDLLTARSWSEAQPFLTARDEGGRSQLQLILLDLALPELTGPDACRRLKADPALRDIPIIIMANSSSSDLVEAFDAGAMDFLRKPVNPIELLARIRSALSLKHELEVSQSQQRALLKLTEELTIANATLERLSLHDGLTGIPNRRAFDAFLDRTWRLGARSNGSVSLIMVDVDLFKPYNDHFGHPAGDRCLGLVARAIAVEARRPTDLGARIGGEEFALVLGDTSLEQAFRVAANLHAAIARLDLPHPRSEIMARITVSLGVAACVPGPGSEPQALIQEADDALYAAKQAGRNGTWPRSQDRLAWEPCQPV